MHDNGALNIFCARDPGQGLPGIRNILTDNKLPILAHCLFEFKDGWRKQQANSMLDETRNRKVFKRCGELT